MKINNAEFVKSVASLDQLPAKELPQIAFVGRSNVGKSSLLNKLLGRKRLALTSGTPGKTRLINFFLINHTFYLVDLPGYGFSKAPASVMQSWKSLVEGYLAKISFLKVVAVFIDCCHRFVGFDLQMIEGVRYYDKPFIVVATKTDKLSRQQLQKQQQHIYRQLPQRQVYFFSAKTGAGKEKLWQGIRKYL